MVEWIAYACGSAVLLGLMPSFLKLGAKKAAPSLGALLMSFIALLFAVGIVVIEDIPVAEIMELDNNSLLYLLLSGTLQGLFWLALCAALSHGEVGRVIPLTNLSAVGSLGLSALLMKTTIGVWKLCCIVLLLIGTFLIECGTDEMGDAKWALYAVFALAFAAAKEVADGLFVTPMQLEKSVETLLCTIVATLVLFCFTVLCGGFQKSDRISADGWIFLVLSGMAVGLAWLRNSQAQMLGDPNYLKPIGCIAFPAALFGGWMLHREDFSGGAMVGVLFALAGMFGMMLAI